MLASTCLYSLYAWLFSVLSHLLLNWCNSNRPIVGLRCPLLSCPVGLSVCAVCLSICNMVYCGQTVGWINMKLDMPVGFDLATLC